MNRIFKPFFVGSATFVVVSAILLSWYDGRSGTMTQQEIEASMAAIEAQAEIFRSPADLAEFRLFLEQDDGAPFYTVNFYKYRKVSRYEKEPNSGYSGREAFDRFSKTMIGLLAAQASHPIFGTDWLAQNETGWDRLVIVRYRSRRDIAAIFANPAFAKASIHKWAALEKNQRFLAQGLHIPDLYLPVILVSFLLAVVAALLAKVLARLVRRFRRTALEGPEG